MWQTDRQTLGVLKSLNRKISGLKINVQSSVLFIFKTCIKDILFLNQGRITSWDERKRRKFFKIFVLERLYNKNFIMNAQTLLLNHYWLLLLKFVFLPGGPWSKRLCRPYAYDYHWKMLLKAIIWNVQMYWASYNTKFRFSFNFLTFYNHFKNGAT